MSQPSAGLENQIEVCKGVFVFVKVIIELIIL